MPGSTKAAVLLKRDVFLPFPLSHAEMKKKINDIKSDGTGLLFLSWL